MKTINRLNVLIFPSGMENGIEIGKSLKYCKEVNLFSATADVPNQAFYLFKKNSIVRDIRTPGWIEDLNREIDRNNIDIIYPANSLIIDFLNVNRNSINADILLPPKEIISATRSKKKTIELLKHTINVPQVYETKDEIESYPIFIKPDRGYGSQGATVVNSETELSKYDVNAYIMQELLVGKEYTIDCFSDAGGKLKFCSGRERSRVRMATSMHAEDVSNNLNDIFEETAHKILSKINISGAWFFQMKEDGQGTLKLLEIDIRIAGTMAFNRCKGINFPLLSLYQFYGHEIDILENQIDFSLERCLKNRYKHSYFYDTVYVDLDDTIIVRNKINTELISYLYQCVNNNIKVVLISKNLRDDKEAYLESFKILQLFDEIIWLKEEDCKYKYITELKSIFIDDSYRQRKEVFDKLGIPTFDCSMVESLLDDRE